jgi:hypothetical protein
VQLWYFGMENISLCVSQVDEIESSLVQRVVHCRGMIMYEDLNQEDEDT